MFNRKRLALSLETDEIRIVVYQREEVLRWDKTPLPEGTVDRGQLIRSEVFGEIARDLLKEHKAPRRKARIALNGQRAILRTLMIPPVPDRMMEETVQREARRELPLPLEDLYLSWQRIETKESDQTSIFVVALPKETVDSHMHGIQTAGVRPGLLDIKPLALVRTVNQPDVIVASLERDTASVVLVRGFLPIITRSINLTPQRGPQALDEHIDQVVAEIQRTLDFYNSTISASHPAWNPVVCLTGKFGGRPEARAIVEDRWPLLEADPPIDLPDDLPLATYMTNIGLILNTAEQG